MDVKVIAHEACAREGYEYYPFVMSVFGRWHAEASLVTKLMAAAVSEALLSRTPRIHRDAVGMSSEAGLRAALCGASFTARLRAELSAALHEAVGTQIHQAGKRPG